MLVFARLGHAYSRLVWHSHPLETSRVLGTHSSYTLCESSQALDPRAYQAAGDGPGGEHDSYLVAQPVDSLSPLFSHTRGLDTLDDRRAVSLTLQKGSASFFLPFIRPQQNPLQLLTARLCLSPQPTQTLCHQPQWQLSGSRHQSLMHATSAFGTLWRTSRRCRSTRIAPVSSA